jgi:hypothetical protein
MNGEDRQIHIIADNKERMDSLKLAEYLAGITINQINVCVNRFSFHWDTLRHDGL